MIRRNDGGLRVSRVPYKSGSGTVHIKLETDRHGKFFFVRGRFFYCIEDLVSYYQAVDVENKHRLGDPLLNETAQSKHTIYKVKESIEKILDSQSLSFPLYFQ